MLAVADGFPLCCCKRYLRRSFITIADSLMQRLFFWNKESPIEPEFVTFHADRPSGLEGMHPNANLQGPVYMRMIDMLFRSVCLFHQDARFTLLTDKFTRVHGIQKPFNRMDSVIDHSSMMMSRSLAQLECIEASDFSRPMVLIDSDMLLNGSLSHLFLENFDVALTWRLNKSMPINGGLIILNNRRPDVVRTFFRRFVDIYRQNYADQSQWYGDQLALMHCIGLSHRALSRSHILKINGCRVLMLPCDTYNFSPECRFSSIVEEFDDKLILHFKGERKKMMAVYWLNHLRPKELSWPLTVIASFLARRYLQHLISQHADDEMLNTMNDEE